MPGGIKEWPEDWRLREKLLKRGSESLTDAEPLAHIRHDGYDASGRCAQDIVRLHLLMPGCLSFITGVQAAGFCRDGKTLSQSGYFRMKTLRVLRLSP